MTQDGTAKDDVKIPEGDIGTTIQAEFDDGKELLVTIVSAMGEEAVRLFLPPPSSRSLIHHTQAISFKEAPKGS